MQKTFLKIFVWLFTLLCLYYALSGIDFSLLYKSITNYSICSIIISVALMLLMLFFGACRKVIMLGSANFISIFKAVLINYTANNIFPAKAGDVLHTFYLAKVLNTSKTRLLHIVFWERFADLNIMLLAISFIAAFIDPRILYAQMFLIFIIWVIVILLKMYPKIIDFILFKLPENKFKDILVIANEEFQAISITLLVKLFTMTILQWCFVFIFYIYNYLLVANINISVTQALTAAVIVSAASIIPSSPGAIGVFEAATIFGLSLFAVPKEEALAIAVLVHVVNIFVPLILCLLSLNIKEIFKIKKDALL